MQKVPARPVAAVIRARWRAPCPWSPPRRLSGKHPAVDPPAREPGALARDRDSGRRAVRILEHFVPGILSDAGTDARGVRRVERDAIWIGIGTCMSLVLYDLAGAIVTRAMVAPDRRLLAPLGFGMPTR